MKFTSFSFAIIFIAAISSRINAVVDPQAMYQDMEKRIAEIKASRSQIEGSLSSANLAKDERKQLDDWKKSLGEEQAILEKRLELFRKLQGSGEITYIAPEEKKDTEGKLP